MIAYYISLYVSRLLFRMCLFLQDVRSMQGRVFAFIIVLSSAPWVLHKYLRRMIGTVFLETPSLLV